MPPPLPGMQPPSSSQARTISTVPMLIESERTQCKFYRFEMKWTIHGFHLDQGASLRSTGVSMAELGLKDYEGRWRIHLTSNSPAPNQDNIVVYLVRTDITETSGASLFTAPSCSGARDIYATAQVRVTTGKSSETLLEGGIIGRTFSYLNNSSGMNVTTRAALFGSNAQPGQLRDGCIKISMQIDLSLQENTSSLTDNGQREFGQRQLQWANSGHEHDTDFLLRSMDGKEFFANPFLLTAHSPIFAAMLSHDTKEKRSMCCEMEDVDGETVVILLDYLYCCETGKITGQNAPKVVLMADKYNLMHLRSVAEQMLTHALTTENAVQVLRFANRNKLDGLKGACLKVIEQNMGIILSDKELVKSDPGTMQIITAHCAEKARLAVKSWEF